MTSNQEELRLLRDVFVRPFYLSLLNGNFTSRDSDRAGALPQKIAEAAREISDAQIFRLFREREWRGRLTAAWFVGLTRRVSFIPEIAELLLASETVYAGQGYCVALGLIGGQQCQHHLRRYLKEYLPLRGRFYDQTWALGALAYIEDAPPQEFLDPMLWMGASRGFDPRQESKTSRILSDI